MTLPYMIKFRVNRTDYEQLLEQARQSGCGTISEYLRNKLLGPFLYIETTLKENNNLLKQIATKINIPILDKRKNNKP